MSRSAIDATRFTATSPHAYSKPFAIRSSSASASSASSSSSHPLPPSFLSPLSKKNALPSQKPSHNPSTPSPQKFAETPAQKVARLRAARFAAKYAEAPLWDRVVIRGRYVADKAHRITVYSLMGLTGLFSFRRHFPPPPFPRSPHLSFLIPHPIPFIPRSNYSPHLLSRIRRGGHLRPYRYGYI